MEEGGPKIGRHRSSIGGSVQPHAFRGGPVVLPPGDDPDGVHQARKVSH